MANQQDDDTEKSHEPTPQKLLDARKKGEVVRSQDVTTAAAYGGFLLAGLAIGASSIGQVGSVMMAFFDQSDRLALLTFSGSGASSLSGMIGVIIFALAGWFLIPGGIALLSVLGQRSFVVSGEKIKPKFSRLGMLQNAKKKFGPSGLFEFFKSFLKLVIFSVCLGLYLNHRLDDMSATLFSDPKVIGALMMRMLVEFMFVVLLISVAIGALDYLWQRFDFMRQNRMSFRELKEEHKRSEGDPHFKQERRQRGQRIASEQMMADVPTADVVIVNPTHYAVALKWSREPGSAPVCVAKGVDHIALSIRECAMENGVPIRHDPPTARALYAGTDVGQEIDADHYRAVAAAIRFARENATSRKELRMTQANTLGELVDLTGALYHAEQAKMRELIEQENKIRAALAKLESNRKAALALPASDLQSIRQLGGDILWQGWIGRNREDLNRKLALCLAQKARVVSGLKRAYGKYTASKELLENENAALRKQKDSAGMERDQRLSLIRSTSF